MLYYLIKKGECQKSKFFPKPTDFEELEEIVSLAPKERKKKAVGKAMHGVGIWVPVKNDIGYRPVTGNLGKNSKRKMMAF